MSSKTAGQILAGYRRRLEDRKDWLHEKIGILKRDNKPHGYELEEFYAMQWVLAFIDSQERLALEHINKDLHKREDRR